MTKITKYSLSVQDPWLTYIEQGIKTVEGRRGDFNKFEKWINNEVLFFNKNKGILVHVLDVHCYKDLYEYLNNEDYQKVLPGISSMQEAINTYHKFYSDDDIKNSGGMCGIVIKYIKTL